MAIRSYKDLVAWQKGMDLVETVYRLTAAFPAEQRYGLTAQLQRAVVSIPSNIAEGHGRSTTADFIRFLDVAIGSANETETQLLIAVRLELVNEPAVRKALAQTTEVQRILKGLLMSLRRSGKTIRD